MNETGRSDLNTIFAEMVMAVHSISEPERVVAAISKLLPFYVRILRVCSDGVLPRSRMRQALVNLNERRDKHGRISYMWNDDVRPTGDAAHTICEVAQVGCEVLRFLKQTGKWYIDRMVGLSSQCIRNINELIDMITLVNSQTLEYSRVGCTGVNMDVFDRAPMGELTRQLRHDSSNERRVADVSEVPGPGVNPKDMKPSDDDAETDLDTQTTKDYAGSADTNEAVELVPEGVDTAHASTSLVAGEPSVTPHEKRSPPSGSELDGFGSELDGSRKTRVGYTRKHKKQNLARLRKNTVPAHAKRTYQCVAYRQVYWHAKAIGKRDVAARAHAGIAYQRAGEEFDALDTIFG